MSPRPTPRSAPPVLVKAGEQLPGFAMLRDDGSTSCGNWIYCGVLVAGRQQHRAARQQRPDRAGRDAELGLRLAGQPAHPLQPRFSADKAGQALGSVAQVPGLERQELGGGADVPDMRPDAAPEQNVMPFIMNPEGVVAVLHASRHGRRPVPRALRALRDTARREPDVPDQPKAVSNPAARVYKGDLEAFGKKGVPVRGHHLPPDRAFPLLDQALAQQRDRAAGASSSRSARNWRRKRASRQGDKVKVRSNRGEVVVACVVTKRIKALDVNGKKVHTTSAFRSTGASRGRRRTATWPMP
jgi:hypothetical protein